MDPDDVARLVNDLKISRQPPDDPPLLIEAETLSIGEKCIDHCLVAKIFSSKAINRDAFITQIPRILQANKHIEIGALGDNMFLLDFKSLQDRKRAISGGPWNIFRNLILFREPRGLQTPSMLSFTDVLFWIQCYNLPIACMHKGILEILGRHLGHIEEIDTRDNGLAMGRYARLKVRIDISKPLKQHV
ncbi:uncharacterized protein [Primulina eburnea]|uniref:uncharacterized protein n=1 Tax=Primulina eburnea TaxID=1245227 RepID=UPI003C6C9CCA